FTPIVINVAASKDDDDRDDPISITAATVTTNALQGTGLAGFLVGNNTASVVGGREGNDFLYGDTRRIISQGHITLVTHSPIQHLIQADQMI
ncbi:hypothetical protein N8000_12090, partial [Rhodospirillales bacterium]|nr:hypothetical protein [Rhodospirillales bacterium]